jgi:ADP-ribose pyrophosphatase YjhB (NUDIX family)
MQLASNVIDVWAFRRTESGPRFLLLYAAEEKARRHFNGGRFWQIPSGFVDEGEKVTDAIKRELGRFDLTATEIWAGEHAYIIYNRRFEEMQLIGVYAAEVSETTARLDPAEHSEFEWLPYEACLHRVHFRGLKDGLRSVHEYITSVPAPATELSLYTARRT